MVDGDFWSHFFDESVTTRILTVGMMISLSYYLLLMQQCNFVSTGAKCSLEGAKFHASLGFDSSQEEAGMREEVAALLGSGVCRLHCTERDSNKTQRTREIHSFTLSCQDKMQQRYLFTQKALC